MQPTKVYDENLKAYKDGYRLIVNKGSSRSTKSWSLSQVYYTISNESTRHRKLSMVSQSFPHLRDGIVYDFERMLRGEGIDPGKIHNTSRHEFLINKSIVNYFSADKGDKVMGPHRDFLWINEPNKGVTFESYIQLRTRTAECIWIDYNPSSNYWLHTEGLLNDERTKVIHSTFLDNPFLTRQQLEDFVDAKRKSKTSAYWDWWWKVYGLGQDSVLMEERIMPFPLGRASKVPDDAVEIPSALDFGFFPDPTAFCRLWIRRKPLQDELYIQQVVYDTRLQINSRGEGVKNLTDILRERGVNPNHHTIAECAEPKAIADMRSAGYSIEAVKKTSVETSIRLFHDYKIFIIDGSEDVYREFDNYRYKRDSKTNEILPIPADKQADHSIDAVRYVLLSRGMRWAA